MGGGGCVPSPTESRRVALGAGAARRLTHGQGRLGSEAEQGPGLRGNSGWVVTPPAPCRGNTPGAAAVLEPGGCAGGGFRACLLCSLGALGTEHPCPLCPRVPELPPIVSPPLPWQCWGQPGRPVALSMGATASLALGILP